MAYDDAWAALRWMASFSDPWLSAYGDPARTFLAGDSVGANIAYDTAVRASLVGGININIEGLLMVHPYFWGVDPLSSWETAWDGVAMFKP
jgi:acetyl esterase/lipase